MPYNAITSRRMAYDIDGTTVGRNDLINGFGTGIVTWLTSTINSNMNSENGVSGIGTGSNSKTCALWFFFPEKREIEKVMLGFSNNNSTTIIIQGSNNTTNGIDGDWETGIWTKSYSSDTDAWRKTVIPISFASPYRVLRISWYGMYGSYMNTFHIYGRKAAGETVDDILFCDIDGNELTTLMDWGDRPEGTTLIKSFKIKNESTDKIANNINLQLNHADFLMSLDQVNWVATIDIASIPANSLSAEIFVKNPLGVPPLTLGPKAARIIATVGSFT